MKASYDEKGQTIIINLTILECKFVTPEIGTAC